MRKQVNRRLLGMFFAVLLLTGLSLSVVHTWQMSRGADDLLVESKRAAERKDYRRSLLYLRHYLDHNPNDPIARLEYAKLITRRSEREANWWHAYYVLQPVLAQDPKADNARNYLALVCVKLKRYEEAIHHLETLRRTAKDPAELEHTLGLCYLAANRVKDAQSAFEHAIQKAPERTNSYVRLAQTWEDQNNREAALAVLDRMVQANPKLADAWLERGKFRRRCGMAELAAQDLSQAASFAPDNVSIVVQAAESACQNDQPDKARDLLKTILKTHPKNENLYLLAARLERDQSKPEAAKAFLRQGLREVPTSAQIMVLLGDVLLELKQTNEAKTLFEQLPRTAKASTWRIWFQAQKAQADQQWVKAARSFEQAKENLVDIPFWLCETEIALAECYHNCGDSAREIEALRRGLQADPHSVRALTQLAVALQSEGMAEESLAIWKRLTESPSATAKGWLHRAQVSIQVNRRRNKKEQNWEEAEQAIRRARQGNRLSIDVALAQSEMLYAQGLDEKAGAILSDLLRQNPKDAQVWVAYALAWTRHEQWAAARNFLENAKGILGDRAELRLARMQILQAQPGLDRTDLQELHQLTRDLDRYTPAEQGKILHASVDVLVRAGEYQQARQLCARWGEVQPKRLEPWIALHGLTASEPDSDLHKQTIQRMRTIEGGQGMLWRFASSLRWMELARQQKNPKALSEAKKILDEAQKVSPAHSRVLILRGQIAEIEGNVDQAIEQYLQAWRRKDYHSATMERLIRLLAKQKRHTEAEEVYEEAEAYLPSTREVARLGTELALQLGKRERASQRAARAVPEDTGDYREHLWLVHVHRELGKNLEALQILRQLARKQGKVPDVWIALVEQLAITGNRSEAKKLIEQLPDKLRPRDVVLTQAKAHWALGDETTAESLFLEVWKQHPNDPFIARQIAQFYLHFERWSEAKKYLMIMTRQTLPLPGDQLRWAKRQLAWIESDYFNVIRNKPESISEVEQRKREAQALRWIAAPSKYDQEHRNRERILIESLLPSRREQALQRWDDQVGEADLFPEEQLALAHLYHALGQHEKARKLMLSLLKQEPRNGRYLATIVWMHRDANHQTVADYWLKRLREVEPASSRTVQLLLGS